MGLDFTPDEWLTATILVVCLAMILATFAAISIQKMEGEKMRISKMRLDSSMRAWAESEVTMYDWIRKSCERRSWLYLLHAVFEGGR